MRTVAFFALVAVFGFVIGCNAAYKPNVNIDHADIKHQSGNQTEIKGEYNNGK